MIVLKLQWGEGQALRVFWNNHSTQQVNNKKFQLIKKIAWTAVLKVFLEINSNKGASKRDKQHLSEAWHTPKHSRAPFSLKGDHEFEHMKNSLLGNKLSGVCWSMATVPDDLQGGKCGIIWDLCILVEDERDLCWCEWPHILCSSRAAMLTVAFYHLTGGTWLSCVLLFLCLSLDECLIAWFLALEAFLTSIQFFPPSSGNQVSEPCAALQ